jgi:hypothetical protein
VPGTWDDAPDAWWRPGSAFTQALTTAGHEVVALPPWTLELDGVLGRHDTWIEGGHRLAMALVAYRDAMVPIQGIIAHSHGGQIALYALAFAASAGVSLDRLVTLGTPVRGDMEAFYRRARPGIGRWTHVYGGSDWWAILGALGDGALRVLRAMPDADVNRFVPEAAHRALVDPALVLEALGP